MVSDVSQPSDLETQPYAVLIGRSFAWATIALVSVFLINNYLSNWHSWPGSLAAFDPSNKFLYLSILQFFLYVLGLNFVVLYIFLTKDKALRPDSVIIYEITNYIIRAAFWSVLLVGFFDMLVSFLRVEGFLQSIVGQNISSELNRPEYRSLYLHLPIFVLGFIIAFIHRGLGFIWLALLVVAAELLIVITRFIFSYEQAFMGDLVRFWYAALFLFASAYTLYEDGHVRVDVLYSLFSAKTKGLVNAIGCVLLGMSLCWIILVLGMANKATIINSPILNFEVTQTGFGMFVKYWMAGFLAVFAVSMLLQFVGYFLESLADYRGEPNKREIAGGHGEGAH
ncbi:MAG: TRAP transporter small permease subunit [Pseudomonadota bacterium]